MEQRIGVTMDKVKRNIEAGEFIRADKGRPETLLSLIRNQQVRGSNPRAGSNDFKGLAAGPHPAVLAV
jgi:hypothetical protein